MLAFLGNPSADSAPKPWDNDKFPEVEPEELEVSLKRYLEETKGKWSPDIEVGFGFINCMQAGLKSLFVDARIEFPLFVRSQPFILLVKHLTHPQQITTYHQSLHPIMQT